ncbi:MAG: murein L,D-transpeptidase family protein [Pararhodobacter sp.]
MIRRTFLLLALAACARPYDGPPVTEVRIYKARRKMELWSGTRRLSSFDIALGGNPQGHKQQRGDSRTPEGVYHIDRRNPNSAFHLSLGISYPDAADVARAQAMGVDPGGDIFIHGTGRFPPNSLYRQGDWTDGCIAVTNEQMNDIYTMVQDGTRVVIWP